MSEQLWFPPGVVPGYSVLNRGVLADDSCLVQLGLLYMYGSTVSIVVHAGADVAAEGPPVVRVWPKSDPEQRNTVVWRDPHGDPGGALAWDGTVTLRLAAGGDLVVEAEWASQGIEPARSLVRQDVVMAASRASRPIFYSAAQRDLDRARYLRSGDGAPMARWLTGDQDPD